MLNFDIGDDRESFRQVVRKFAENEIKPKAIELDRNEEFSLEITQKMGELGLFSFLPGEEYGGAGMDYVSYIIAVEEIARVDGSHAATVAAGNSLGIGPLYYFGNEEQKQKWLPTLVTGEGLAAFGLTEPNAGSDAGGSKTHARWDSEKQRWILNGSKIFITNASTPISKVIIVQAVTGVSPEGKKEYCCFLLPTDTPGFSTKTIHGKMMWRASNTAELYFEDVELPPESMLGERGDGFRQMLSTLDRGRLSIGAMGLGGAQGAFEMALAYAKERQQFGRSISKFQAIAFKLADMATEIEAARLMLYKACWLADEKRDFKQLAAMAKLYCSEVMSRVVDQAVQIHGGYGLMQEYHIERFYRDQKLLEIGEGTSEIQRLVISRTLGC
jgi:alkylation response protein AidB-like acyl-CoA dehydrogenase